MQHADDVLRLVAPERNAGVFGGEHLAHQLFRRHVGIDRHHGGAMNHDVGYGQITEAEDIVDVFGLAAFDDAVLGGFFHEPFDFGVGQDFMLRGFLYATQAQNASRGRVEQPVERIEHDVRGIQRIGDPLRDRHGPADRKRLRHLLADHDMQGGEHQEPCQERGEVESGFRQPQRLEKRSEQRRDRGLADPAEAERGHGDAKLAARQIGLDVVHHASQQACAKAVLLDHDLDAKAAAFHQRELGRHVEGVGRKQQDGKRQIDRDRVHRCLAIFPAPRDAPGTLCALAVALIPPVSAAGNRAPAQARRPARSRRGRSLPAG